MAIVCSNGAGFLLQEWLQVVAWFYQLAVDGRTGSAGAGTKRPDFHLHPTGFYKDQPLPGLVTVYF